MVCMVSTTSDGMDATASGRWGSERKWWSNTLDRKWARSLSGRSAELKPLGGLSIRRHGIGKSAKRMLNDTLIQGLQVGRTSPRDPHRPRDGRTNTGERTDGQGGNGRTSRSVWVGPHWATTASVPHQQSCAGGTLDPVEKSVPGTRLVVRVLTMGGRLGRVHPLGGGVLHWPVCVKVSPIGHNGLGDPV